jgi:hypothetical protein
MAHEISRLVPLPFSMFLSLMALPERVVDVPHIIWSFLTSTCLPTPPLSKEGFPPKIARKDALQTDLSFLAVLGMCSARDMEVPEAWALCFSEMVATFITVCTGHFDKVRLQHTALWIFST